MWYGLIDRGMQQGSAIHDIRGLERSREWDGPADVVDGEFGRMATERRGARGS
jgi:hypothetical protein